MLVRAESVQCQVCQSCRMRLSAQGCSAPLTHETRASASRAGFTTMLLPRAPVRRERAARLAQPTRSRSSGDGKPSP
eukprot:4857636-Pleurochrysis_carterae.AAC.1